MCRRLASLRSVITALGTRAVRSCGACLGSELVLEDDVLLPFRGGVWNIGPEMGPAAFISRKGAGQESPGDLKAIGHLQGGEEFWIPPLPPGRQLDLVKSPRKPVHDGKSFLDAANGLQTGKTARRAITKTLNAPTITPYFGQSPVTLDWDKTSVASRPGPVRVPDSSAPQPPGAQPTGPVELRVRFNPLISLRAGFIAGSIFLCVK